MGFELVLNYAASVPAKTSATATATSIEETSTITITRTVTLTSTTGYYEMDMFATLQKRAQQTTTAPAAAITSASNSAGNHFDSRLLAAIVVPIVFVTVVCVSMLLSRCFTRRRDRQPSKNPRPYLHSSSYDTKPQPQPPRTPATLLPPATPLAFLAEHRDSFLPPPSTATSFSTLASSMSLSSFSPLATPAVPALMRLPTAEELDEKKMTRAWNRHPM